MSRYNALLQDINQPSVQLRLNVRDADTDDVTPTIFTVDADKFKVLLHGMISLSVCMFASLSSCL